MSQWGNFLIWFVLINVWVVASAFLFRSKSTKDTDQWDLRRGRNQYVCHTRHRRGRVVAV
jgi:hypothetical protein